MGGPNVTFPYVCGMVVTVYVGKDVTPGCKRVPLVIGGRVGMRPDGAGPDGITPGPDGIIPGPEGMIPGPEGMIPGPEGMGSFVDVVGNRDGIKPDGGCDDNISKYD